MRQRMAFRFIPLDDEFRLTREILAVGVFAIPVWSKVGQTVAQAFGCL